MMAAVTYSFARHEKKCILTLAQRDALIETIGDRLVPDAWGRSTIRSLYCDTPSHLLIRRSCESPDYKEKIRIRSYRAVGPDDEVFLELKKKCDGITYKRRATMPLSRALAFVDGHGDPKTQIEREIDFATRRYEGLRPTMLIACEREAFFDACDPSLRLTFDYGIRYAERGGDGLSGDTEGRPLIGDDTCVMEIKCGESMPLWLVHTMSAMGLRITGFSKYGRAWQEQVRESRAVMRPMSQAEWRPEPTGDGCACPEAGIRRVATPWHPVPAIGTLGPMGLA